MLSFKGHPVCWYISNNTDSGNEIWCNVCHARSDNGGISVCSQCKGIVHFACTKYVRDLEERLRTTCVDCIAGDD